MAQIGDAQPNVARRLAHDRPPDHLKAPPGPIAGWKPLPPLPASVEDPT